MQKIYRTIAILLLCGALCAPCTEARGRNNGQDKPEQHQTRPTQSRNGKKHGSRPGNNRPPQPGRPDNKKPHGPQRPPQGNHHGQPQRPPQRPTPGPQATPHHHHHVNYGRPHRPNMPPPRPYHRPAPPPPSWHPHSWRPFRSILGVALGTTVNLSINALINNGYNVSGYDNNVVYLANVPMLNYSWPVANLHYGNAGLDGSEFVYYTSGYNLGRYNAVYNSLTSAYGRPYAVQNLAGGGRRAVWWGNDGQYITLSFGSGYAAGGGLNYYTTLSFGR
ncbi:MAG: hypothetical protein K2F97_06610 [Muribaculaceae bacterium]|nr:hypothetical protein [Muribaculaceae bacterium]